MMSTPVKITVTPERIALRPGESADVEVTIQNASPVVEHYSTTVVGLPSKELSSCEPDVVQLRPKEVGNVRLQVSVPEKGGLVAGPYALGVLVRSPYQREVSRCEELALDVQPAPSLTMAVQPEVATGGKVGHYMVSLANEGNTPLAVTLSGGDPENLVGFDIRPRELRLEPGMAASAQVTASAMPPLTGQDVRRALTLRAHAGEVVVERPVALVQKPRIKGGWMKIGALTAGLAVLTGATLGGAALIRSVKQTANPPAAVNASDNKSQGQQPPPTQPSQGQPSQQPSAPPQNPSSGAQPPPSNNGQPSSGGNPPPQNGGQTFLDIAKDAQATGTRVLNADRYQPYGVNMSGDISNPATNCANANAQSFRILTAPDFAPYGAFLTSSTGDSAAKCNNMPVVFEFLKPVNQVKVAFTGSGAEYMLTVKFADGSTDSRTAKSTTPGSIATVEYIAQGKQIISAKFVHSNPNPNVGEFTLITGLGFTPA
jgi:hypothetical protein